MQYLSRDTLRNSKIGWFNWITLNRINDNKWFIFEFNLQHNKEVICLIFEIVFIRRANLYSFTFYETKGRGDCLKNPYGVSFASLQSESKRKLMDFFGKILISLLRHFNPVCLLLCSKIFPLNPWCEQITFQHCVGCFFHFYTPFDGFL